MTSIHLTPPPISKQSMADLLCTVVVLCQARDENNDPFWAYICVKPSMAKAFKEARDSGKINLEEYGAIIEWGRGDIVPAEVKKRMERDFAVNHHYERDLINAIEAAKNKF